MAAQCPSCGLYVVFDEMLHLEFADRESGGMGDVVVTSLVNHGMPFIRYAIGDVASGFGEGCECGMAQTTLASVGGKTRELIATRRGGYVSTLFYEVFEGMPVRKYSVVQRDYERFTVFTVPEDGFDGDHATAIVERMKGLLGKVEVECIEVGAIPPHPGGKRIYVYSEVPNRPSWGELN